MVSAAVLPNAVNGSYAVCLQQQLQQVVSAAAAADVVVVVVDGDVPVGHVTAAPLPWGPSGANVHRLGYPGCGGTVRTIVTSHTHTASDTCAHT